MSTHKVKIKHILYYTTKYKETLVFLIYIYFKWLNTHYKTAIIINNIIIKDN